MTFSVEPPLPGALKLNSATGVISGTALLAQEPTDYVVTGDDGTHTATVTLTIVVAPSVTPATQPLKAIPGEDITPVSLRAHGLPGPVLFSVATSSPPLPEGLNLAAGTAANTVVIEGAPTTVQAETTIVIAARGGAFEATAEVVVTIACVDPLALGSECALPEVPSVSLMSLLATAMDASGPTGIHDPNSVEHLDSCAGCHRTHTSQESRFLGEKDQTSTDLCFTCHNGTGGSVYSQYYSGTYPNGASLYTNDSATRAYFQHDPTSTNIKNAFYSDDEGTAEPSPIFEGAHLRRSACVDCHNPHNATATPPAQAASSATETAGWTAPGRLAGASGVKVANGAAAGSTPTYTLLGGSNGRMTREYQLCFKCHSGYTDITNAGFASEPSKWWLDKAIEFNPANESFHPVEAAGKNRTGKMSDSLTFSTPYRLFDLTNGGTTDARDALVRCTNCHSGSPVNGQTQASDAAVHVSPNRGILILPLRDRVLKASNAGYSDADSALCYACHTNRPFKTESDENTATNFPFHYKHMSAIAGANGRSGPEFPIDAADPPGTTGVQAGNAICSECHFRLHSSVTETPAGGGTQDLGNGSRLVSFSPNVSAGSGGVIKWVQATPGDAESGSCTLKCHGYTHNAKKY